MEMKNLQKQLENRNEVVASLKKQVSAMESRERETRMQIADFQNQLKEMKEQKKKQEVATSLKSEIEKQCEAEVKKELEKVLPTAVERGLRDLPFEMVCAYKDHFYGAYSTINYDEITVDVSNADRPGGLFVQIC